MQYIVFSPAYGQYITTAASWVAAIQNVIAVAPGFADDYRAQPLDAFSAKWQAHLLSESQVIA
jgi:hypothetical protein